MEKEEKDRENAGKAIEVDNGSGTVYAGVYRAGEVAEGEVKRESGNENMEL